MIQEHKSRGASKLRTRTGIFAIIGLMALYACTATRKADGSWDFSFAPDMTINAIGLEDAKNQIGDLWRNCLAGTWTRPCTDAEIADIKKTYDNIIEKKAKLNTHLRANPDEDNETTQEWMQANMTEADWETLALTSEDNVRRLAAL
jgi:hypothetical protein